jgi:amidase
VNDAVAQAELVRSGVTTPEELVREAITRIEERNPSLNAVIHERFDRALEEAKAVDRSAPFAGVPFLAKDGGCAMAGEPYHVGLGPLKAAGFRAPEDSELYSRFRRAGFVCLGRTNVPQLLLSATTEPDAYGPTRNPHDLDRSPGGSSGGAAAAVASGMVAVAHGNDAGGSIRIPAALCGVIGLKPTRHRVLEGAVGMTWNGLNHEFGLTRSVRDTAGLLDALGDHPWRGPATDGPLRVRVVAGIDRVPTDPEIAAAVDAVAGRLSDLGHDVAATTVPELEGDNATGAVISASAARDVERLAALAGVTIDPEDLEPLPGMIVAGGRAMTGLQLQAAVEGMHAYGRRLEARWSDFDVLLTPTLPVSTPRIGEVGPHAPFEQMAGGLGAMTVFTIPFDASGQPAISLPLGTTSDGMPIGVQLVARSWREDVLVDLAGALLD